MFNALDLYELGLCAEAYSMSQIALHFDFFNDRASIAKWKSIKRLKHFAQLAEKGVLNTNPIGEYDDEKEDDRTIDYSELMTEGYDGARKERFIGTDEDDPERIFIYFYTKYW